MMPTPSTRALRWLVLLALAVAAVPAVAQRRGAIEEPKLFKWWLTGASLGVYGEGVHEEYNAPGGVTTTYDRSFLAPSFGVGAAGSIYHPNLAQYTFNGEFAPGWATQKVSPGNPDQQRNEFDWLANVFANVYLLNDKPYSSSLFLDQSHSFRDYGFFNTVTVDSRRYGGYFGYSEGPVPVRVSVYRREEEISDPSYASFVREMTLSFDARNSRRRGETAFNYTFRDYEQTNFGLTGGGTDHGASLSDTETFGSRNQIRLGTAVGFAHREYAEAPGDDLNANANLTYEHSPRLTTFYEAFYYRTDSEGVLSETLDASASIAHQLYESLTSTLRVDGANYSSAGAGGRADTTRYGISLSEGYAKRLGRQTRLHLNASLRFDETDRSNSGALIPVVNESHTFGSSGGGSAFQQFSLQQPYVIVGTIRVKDATNPLLIYLEGRDYRVFRNGALTYIERTVTSTIPDGGSVLVDYSAEPSPTGSYETWTSLVQVRLDLWNGLAGVYGRLHRTFNDAPANFVVQDVWSWAFGADVNWRWLRAGAEYEFYDSSFSSYRTARLYESLNFRLSDASSLGFDFSQAWTRYLDANRDEQYYSAIGRYHRTLTAHLGLDLEAGVSQRMGRGVDQTQATVRPGLEFVMGQLSVKAGYTFEYDKFLNTEEHLKNLLFVKVRRSF